MSNTPRTDAFAEKMSKGTGIVTAYMESLKHAVALETDIQHLARVAEEALAHIKAYAEHKRAGSFYDDKDQAEFSEVCEEALSEIKRIKTKI